MYNLCRWPVLLDKPVSSTDATEHGTPENLDGAPATTISSGGDTLSSADTTRSSAEGPIMVESNIKSPFNAEKNPTSEERIRTNTQAEQVKEKKKKAQRKKTEGTYMNGNSFVYGMPAWLQDKEFSSSIAEELLIARGGTPGLFVVSPVAKNPNQFDVRVIRVPQKAVADASEAAEVKLYSIVPVDRDGTSLTIAGFEPPLTNCRSVNDVLEWMSDVHPESNWTDTLVHFVSNDSNDTVPIPLKSYVVPTASRIRPSSKGGDSALLVSTIDQTNEKESLVIVQSKWKCGECGMLQHDTAKPGCIRICSACGKSRGTRRVPENEIKPVMVPSYAPPVRSVNSDVENVRNDLHIAVQKLSNYRQQKLYTSLAK